MNLVNGQHSSGSAEWWTPPEYVDPARELWPVEDGLEQPWDAETVWCNAPSRRGENSAWEWWLKAGREWTSGRARRVWFVVFNPSAFFQIAQEKARGAGIPTPQQAVRIEFVERVEYLRPSDSLALPGVDDAHAVRGKAPPHGSGLLFLPGDPSDVDRAIQAYAHLGDALLPYRPAQRTS